MTNIDSVAQLVEQMTLNHWVESSNLSGVTELLSLWKDSYTCQTIHADENVYYQ